MNASENQPSLLASSNRKWIITGVIVAAVAVGVSAVYFNSRSKKPPKKSNSSARHRKNIKDKSARNSDTKRSHSRSSSTSSDLGNSTPEQAAITPLPRSPEKSSSFSLDSVSSLDSAQFNQLISGWSSDEKQKFAQKLKTKGNDLYKTGKFADAVSYYSRSILLQPESAIYWCNRAACYANLNQPLLVIEDCTKALELDMTYGKALHRRAIAYEQTDKLNEALHDYSVLSFLDGTNNNNASNASERLMRTIAETDAKKLFVNKAPALPSSTFIQAYLDAFRPVTCEALESKKPNLQPNSAEHFLERALEDISVRMYDNADENILKAIDVLDANSSTENEIVSYIYNIAGTFYFLKGKVDLAADYFEKSLQLDDKNINTLIKCSNLLMEKGDHTATLETFDKAISISESNPDIYYHRGQVNFLIGDFTAACADYQKSIELDPKFHPAYIQLGVSQYKLGSIPTAMGTFKTAMSLFPKNAEVFNYYSELLQDQGRFDEANQYYDKAIECAPTQPLAYVNKAVLMFQVFQDAPAAEKLLRKALEQDPKADMVLVQLANFLLPIGKLDEAMECFDKAVSLSRTEPELTNVLLAKVTGMTQLNVLKTLPPEIIARRFGR